MEEKKFTLTLTEEEAIRIYMMLDDKMYNLYQASKDATREYQHNSLLEKAQEAEKLADKVYVQIVEQKHK